MNQTKRNLYSVWSKILLELRLGKSYGYESAGVIVNQWLITPLKMNFSLLVSMPHSQLGQLIYGSTMNSPSRRLIKWVAFLILLTSPTQVIIHKLQKGRTSNHVRIYETIFWILQTNLNKDYLKRKGKYKWLCVANTWSKEHWTIGNGHKDMMRWSDLTTLNVWSTENNIMV